MGEDCLRNPDLVREMEARGSVVSKARLIRRVPTSCVIGELLEEFVRLFSEVTTRLVRERHEVVAHGEAGIIPVAVLLDGTGVGGVPSGGSTASVRRRRLLFCLALLLGCDKKNLLTVSSERIFFHLPF